MAQQHTIQVIAHIRSDFHTKFGIPRQSGLAEALQSTIVFEPAYRNPEALRGIEGFSHLWLIWEFSEFKDHKQTLTVRPPRLGGNKRIGIFATRSPLRPNPIGLSSVKLEEVIFDEKSGPILIVSGADLMNGTPIYDIKPYIAYTDSHPEAKGSFTDDHEFKSLEVTLGEGISIPEEIEDDILSLLSLDSRPQYHDDPDRIYGMSYAGYDVRFRVKERVLTIVEIVRGC